MNEELDLLENSELGALSHSRIGSGFVDDKKILHPKKSIGIKDVSKKNMSGGYLNAAGVSNEERELRSKYGAEIKSCEQGQLLLEQVENEVKKYSSILTTTRKARERKKIESFLKAAESQKTRIKNALTRLKCEKATAQEQEEKFMQQLTSAAASSNSAEASQSGNKTIMYVGIAAGVLILGAVAYIISKK